MNYYRENEYKIVIKKGYREGMRSDAVIYVNKNLEKFLEKEAINQIINVTTLPSIVGSAIAMPDIHKGYGFPIGGVAAFDVDGGVISPGGVGYDINCLASSTKIFLPFGTYKNIEDFVEKKLPKTIFLNSDGKIKETDVVAWMKREENNFIFEIKTKFGFSLRVTYDHPIFDGKKMIEVANLKEGDKIVINPFTGVEYEEVSNEVLVDEETVIQKLKELKISSKGNRYSQIIKWLYKKNLLPLRKNSYQIPYLIKIMGIIFGDGAMNFNGKRRKGTITIYGKKEDLLDIQFDLLKIGVNSKIYLRKRYHKITTNYNKTYSFFTDEYVLKISSTAFSLLLNILGVPVGNKTSVDFKVPLWILSSPLWYKRLFIASFFGAELSKPKTLNNCNFYPPTLNINKNKKIIENGYKFLADIKKILLEFGINTTDIVEVKGLSGKKTIGLRFQVKSNTENLINFFAKVGFEYNREAKKFSNTAVAYLKYKEKIVSIRKSTREILRSLYKNRTPVSTLLANYLNPKDFIDESFILHSIYSTKRDNPRISSNFPSYKEFLSKYLFNEEGLIIDEIENIERKPYKGYVYDITIKEKEHNFIADNFVVSNCGVRLCSTALKKEDIKGREKELVRILYDNVPLGVGSEGNIYLSDSEYREVLLKGARWAVEKEYGSEDDLENIESNGCIKTNADSVTKKAIERGRSQLGTLGSGNHFLEVSFVDEIFDYEIAEKLGFFKGQIFVMIHTGSRGFGHQICSDYVNIILKASQKYGIKLYDRELAAAPFKSDEGQRYFYAMNAAANYAFANRQILKSIVEKTFLKFFRISKEMLSMSTVYDVAHNIAKIEKHIVDGKEKTLIVHRKGATRAFSKNCNELPLKYRDFGQPVIIPGDMGRFSYLLLGSDGSKETFGSSCHGAGRVLSRTKAIENTKGRDIRKELEESGIYLLAGSRDTIYEEVSDAYKDVSEVVEVVCGAGISKKLIRFKPICVIKG
jgi:tRNA-splicing ligase RtcB